MLPRNNDARLRNRKISGRRSALRHAPGSLFLRLEIEFKHPGQRLPHLVQPDFKQGEAPHHIKLLFGQGREVGLVHHLAHCSARRHTCPLLSRRSRSNQRPVRLVETLFPETKDFFTDVSAPTPVLPFVLLLRCFSSAFFAAALRRRISVFAYIVPRHLRVPQLQIASSSPPS